MLLGHFPFNLDSSPPTTPTGGGLRVRDRNIAIGVGVGVGGAILLIVFIIVIVGLCVYCRKKKQQVSSKYVINYNTVYASTLKILLTNVFLSTSPISYGDSIDINSIYKRM